MKTTLLQSVGDGAACHHGYAALPAVEPPVSLTSTAADGHADTVAILLLDDPSLRRQLGDDGRRFVEAHHDMAQLGERFRAVCQRLETG